MSRFLKYLQIEIDSNTPKDILQGGQMVDGLQAIYEDMPEGNKKDLFASAIADTAAILMRRINALKGVTNPKVEEELKEMEVEKQERQEQETKREVKEMKQAPNPVQDKSLDKVDPPIEKDVIPTEETEDVDTNLQDLINTIHNLEF